MAALEARQDQPAAAARASALVDDAHEHVVMQQAAAAGRAAAAAKAAAAKAAAAKAKSAKQLDATTPKAKKQQLLASQKVLAARVATIARQRDVAVAKQLSHTRRFEDPRVEMAVIRTTATAARQQTAVTGAHYSKAGLHVDSDGRVYKATVHSNGQVELTRTGESGTDSAGHKATVDRKIMLNGDLSKVRTTTKTTHTHALPAGIAHTEQTVATEDARGTRLARQESATTSDQRPNRPRVIATHTDLFGGPGAKTLNESSDSAAITNTNGSIATKQQRERYTYGRGGVLAGTDYTNSSDAHTAAGVLTSKQSTVGTRSYTAGKLTRDQSTTDSHGYTTGDKSSKVDVHTVTKSLLSEGGAPITADTRSQLDVTRTITESAQSLDEYSHGATMTARLTETMSHATGSGPSARESAVADASGSPSPQPTLKWDSAQTTVHSTGNDDDSVSTVDKFSADKLDANGFPKNGVDPTSHSENVNVDWHESLHDWATNNMGNVAAGLAIAGMALQFIPVVGNVVGGVLLLGSVGAGAINAGLQADAAANGRASWGDVGFAALGMIPGAGAGIKGTVAAVKAATGVASVARGVQAGITAANMGNMAIQSYKAVSDGNISFSDALMLTAALGGSASSMRAHSAARATESTRLTEPATTGKLASEVAGAHGAGVQSIDFYNDLAVLRKLDIDAPRAAANDHRSSVIIGTIDGDFWGHSLLQHGHDLTTLFDKIPLRNRYTPASSGARAGTETPPAGTVVRVRGANGKQRYYKIDDTGHGLRLASTGRPIKGDAPVTFSDIAASNFGAMELKLPKTRFSDPVIASMKGDRALIRGYVLKALGSETTKRITYDSKGEVVAADSPSGVRRVMVWNESETIGFDSYGKPVTELRMEWSRMPSHTADGTATHPAAGQWQPNSIYPGEYLAPASSRAGEVPNSRAGVSL